MTIGRRASSWIRNRIDPALREAVAAAGPGVAHFDNAIGRGWVSCQLVTDGATVVAAGPDPRAAFDRALRDLRAAPAIDSLLGGAA